MKITGTIIAKRIEQVLIVAAVLAYWAPALSYVGARIEAHVPLFQSVAQQPKNTTVAFEVFDRGVAASAVE